MSRYSDQWQFDRQRNMHALFPAPPEPLVVQPGCVMVPRNVYEARAMMAVASSYLDQHDPDRGKA